MAIKYGENGYDYASSANPRERVESKLGSELRGKQRGLDNVIANGSRHSDSPDVFNARGNVKAAPAVAVGMKNPTANPAKVPGAYLDGDADDSQGVRPSSKRI